MRRFLRRERTGCRQGAYRAALQFEEFERRIVFDQSLGAAIELNIDTVAHTTPPESLSSLPADIQFRSTAEDFEYASKDLSPEAIDDLIATTEEWNQNPVPAGIYRIDNTHLWRKGPGHYSPTLTPEGVIVAERLTAQTDAHAMMATGIRRSDCYNTGGMYTQQDYHYQISFDVRHPLSEMSWLTDHSWGIVLQLWGPREPGESPRNPPFSIYSTSVDGQPHWVVQSYGDSRRVTQSGDFEEKHGVPVPMREIGEWHRFDVEFVPNPHGKGMIRTWLDGELIAEWKDIKNIYYSMFGDQPTGPLNPGFGLYSSMDEDGMEVHLDNISIQCNGRYESSIAGVVSGTTNLENNVVFATNKVTGESFGVYTGSSGVYTLAVPKGLYAVTAVNQETGEQTVADNVTTASTSQLINLDVSAVPPAPLPTLTLTGDVTGDGKSEIINQLPDGSWQVSVANGVGNYDTSTWARWSTNVEWSDIKLADFTGDGKQDIVGRVADGNWWVAESTGSSFQSHHWGKWSSTRTWTNVMVGDFNADTRADIASPDPASGNWWVATSTGTRFATHSWGQWSAAIGWVDISVGDFNGDGRSDIAGRLAADGNWWIALSTGTEFQNHYWGTWSSSVAWHEVNVGDFNGDGISDIVGRTGGTWWVAHSTGDRFQNTRWASWSKLETWSEVSVVDVNGDGNHDLVGRASSDGSWWVARSNGNQFLNHFWGAAWSSYEDWLAVHVDDFDGDGKSDLLGATRNAWLMYL